MHHTKERNDNEKQGRSSEILKGGATNDEENLLSEGGRNLGKVGSDNHNWHVVQCITDFCVKVWLNGRAKAIFFDNFTYFY